MKFPTSLLLALLSFTTLSANNENFTKYVNTFVGSDFHGHTFPGATYTFGMMQLSPDTRLSGWDGCSGYHYSDTAIYGFSHTHLSGTGIADYADILVIPVNNYPLTQGIKNEEYKSGFSHLNEKASPGYYEVFLDKWNVLVKLTTGKRAGIHSYTFKANNPQPGLIIDLTHRDPVINSKIEIVGDNAIQGFRRSSSWAKDQIVYFYIEFSKNGKSILYKDDKALTDTKVIEGKNCKVYFGFTGNVKQGAQIFAKIGISSVSKANAKMNLLSEIPEWNFEGVKNMADKAWNDFLGKIAVKTDNGKNGAELLKTFYTALYHSAIHPNLYSDVNGEYRGMDRKIHKAEGYEQYTVFSLWDTFRALHPLLTIIDQKRTNDFINSFLSIYREAGKLPIWELARNETNCMIAYHSVPVIADAYIKGIRGYNPDDALGAMVAASKIDEYGKQIYIQNGYLPADKENESISKTLEYSYDDWTIAQMAKYMNREDLYNEYIKRAQYYKNVFDPSTGFMRPKLNGKWLTPFDPAEVNNHFTEANSWQYSFFVPQDVYGHIALIGGHEKYCAKLDSLFTTSSQTTGRNQSDITGLIGQYAHGNEPSHHVAYLYNYAGKPWRTQEVVRKILTTLYTSKPDGLCGNDDCGQMSAWYVMSALGFYQVCPGNPTYSIGSPMFSNVQIHLENGKTFTIETKNPEYGYIKSALLNGKPYTKSYFTHSNISSGATLSFTMDSVPNKEFGAAHNECPVSEIIQPLPINGVNNKEQSQADNEIVINPWFEYSERVFRDSAIISIKNIYTKDTAIYGSAKFTTKEIFPKYTIWYKINNAPEFT